MVGCPADDGHCVLVLVSVFLGKNGSDADVVLGGQDNTSMIHQSSGIHLLEVSDSGSSGKCENFSWSEVTLGIFGGVVPSQSQPLTSLLPLFKEGCEEENGEV